jgi:hypothetical protein
MAQKGFKISLAPNKLQSINESSDEEEKEDDNNNSNLELNQTKSD